MAELHECLPVLALGKVSRSRRSLASMDRFGDVTDFLPSPFVRVREQCPAARFLTSRQTLMPERDQPHFHVDESRPHG
jgi:hypothetical protein